MDDREHDKLRDALAGHLLEKLRELTVLGWDDKVFHRTNLSDRRNTLTASFMVSFKQMAAHKQGHHFRIVIQ